MGSSSARRAASRRETGSVMLLAVTAMVALLGAGALAVDVGYLLVVREQLQGAADAAALAATGALDRGAPAARAAALAFAAQNRADNAPLVLTDEDVELGLWDPDARSFSVLAAADEHEADAVRVRARLGEVDLFFARVLGRETASASAFSIAHIPPAARCGPFIGLEKVELKKGYTDSYNSGEGSYAPGLGRDQGHVCSNGPVDVDFGVVVNGDVHDDGEKNERKGTITGSDEPLNESLELTPLDPGDAASNNDNDSIPLSDLGEDPVDDDEFELEEGDGVDLPPGRYYFKKFKLKESATVRISGATTLFVESFEVEKGSVANASLRPANLRIFPSKKVKIDKDSALHAVVYGPEAKIEIKGNSDFFGMAVGKELKLDGYAGFHYDESLASQSYVGIKSPTALVE